MARPAGSSRPASLALAAGVALALAGCATAPPPKGSYRVLGTTYTPLARADGYTETGLASWYGAELHGKHTSNGEPYDMYARTCAHKLLPLGTVVSITNLENGLSTVARVNDRGPFVDERVVDLSYTLACDLGIAEKGTARVRVDALSGPDGAAPPGPVLGGPFAWQVGAFTVAASAQGLAETLRADFSDVTVEPFQRGDASFQRVRVGNYPTTAEAQAARRSLERRGLHGFLVRRD